MTMAAIASRAQPADLATQARRALIVLTVVNGLSFVDRNVFNVLLEPIKHSLGVSDSFLGFVSGFGFVLLYCAFSVPVGWLADRVSRVRILSTGLLCWGAMTVFSGLAANATQLALARAAVGCAEAANAGPAQSLLADLYPPRLRGRAMSVLASGVFAGVMLGFVIGGLVNARFGWRAAFFAAGLPAVIVAIILPLLVREPLRGQQDRGELQVGGSAAKTPALPLGQALRALLHRRSYLAITLGFCLVSLCNAALAAWTVPALLRVHHMDPAVAGPISGVMMGLAGLAGSIVGAWIMPRLVARRADWVLLGPALAALAAAPCLVAFCLAPSLPVVFAGLIGGTLLAGFQIGPLIACLQNVCRAHVRGLGGSLANVATNLLGWGLGPLIVGMANDALASRLGDGTLQVTLLVAPVASLAGGLLMLATRRRYLHDTLDV